METTINVKIAKVWNNRTVLHCVVSTLQGFVTGTKCMSVHSCNVYMVCTHANVYMVCTHANVYMVCTHANVYMVCTHANVYMVCTHANVYMVCTYANVYMVCTYSNVYMVCTHASAFYTRNPFLCTVKCDVMTHGHCLCSRDQTVFIAHFAYASY